MNSAQNAAHEAGSLIIFLILLAVLIYAGVAFFRGPARRSQEYADMIASQIPDANDSALFLSLYRQKGGKSVVAAWILTVCFSPTIAYLYLGEYMKSLIALITLQGLGVWWVISWFSMPTEALLKNKQAADEALIQIRLMRPQLNVVPAQVWPPSPTPTSPAI